MIPELVITISGISTEYSGGYWRATGRTHPLGPACGCNHRDGRSHNCPKHRLAVRSVPLD